ncbi:MAG: hypothetical protein GZ089_15195, partial [Aromatoleum sp.]|nr:hypothetical protein [Aromatoleum sp.]
MNTVPQTASPAEDWLDTALFADGVEHRADYVNDAGFTARVMAALPPPATLPAWRKPALIGLWALAAVGIAVALPGTMTDVTREVFRIIGGQPVSLPGIVAGA